MPDRKGAAKDLGGEKFGQAPTWTSVGTAGLRVHDRLADRAARAADFLWTHVRAEDGTLYRRWRKLLLMQKSVP